MADKIKKGTFVRVRRVILEAGQRDGRIPDETRIVPFVMWGKGFLQRDADLGEEVTVLTRTGRFESGVLEEACPQYELDYGKFVPELLRVGDDARAMLLKDGLS
ncbi:MAG: 2-amino-4-ketopentanoate thiolase [Synergistaceae bacterium]|jgi:hypothetical protein|nr:2-amino-4-ketopentanoate thiolase [Synergistaceae bacterium]